MKNSSYIHGHEYVDLGLPSGLKWATCNVGANKPEDYGDYYAWGETEAKSTYTKDNSLTYGLANYSARRPGIADENLKLTPSYDAARANWGGSWRLPTLKELKELEDKCIWKWTTQNGVKGCQVIGPKGNSIFLPAAGSRYESSLSGAGNYGRYWSSTSFFHWDWKEAKENYADAHCLNFEVGGVYLFSSYRHGGRSVRPVSE